MSNNERTFLIIKPDGVQRGLIAPILSRWEQRGFKLVAMKFFTASEELVGKHYAEHAERPFFKDLVSFLSSGPIVTMVWEGKGVVAASRSMIGVTKPLESAPGTVRGDFAIEVDRNIIHGSDSVDSANREIALWFAESEIVSWVPHETPDVYH